MNSFFEHFVVLPAVTLLGATVCCGGLPGEKTTARCLPFAPTCIKGHKQTTRYYLPKLT